MEGNEPLLIGIARRQDWMSGDNSFFHNTGNTIILPASWFIVDSEFFNQICLWNMISPEGFEITGRQAGRKPIMNQVTYNSYQLSNFCRNHSRQMWRGYRKRDLLFESYRFSGALEHSTLKYVLGSWGVLIRTWVRSESECLPLPVPSRMVSTPPIQKKKHSRKRELVRCCWYINGLRYYTGYLMDSPPPRAMEIQKQMCLVTRDLVTTLDLDSH